MLWLGVSAAAIWLLVLVLPWRSWSTRERIDVPQSVPAVEPGRVGVLVPARNEAATIAQTLESVAGQPGVALLVVVDDQSSDATAVIAARLPGVKVVDGQPAPPGWSGKLWALQQGLDRIDSPLVLLLDADIRLAPGMLAALVDKLEREQLDQVSIMAQLPNISLPEKLLLPAFVFFFKQIYPFAWVNRDDRPFAAAAGGCVLVRRECLLRAGAFSAWKGALIDDCEMALRVRGAGGKIWLGLSHGVQSMRRHPDFESILETVRRTAYTQLGYSPAWLLAASLLMCLAFAVPVLALCAGLVLADGPLLASGAVGWLLMAAAYAPQVRFSGLGLHWALSLPFSAALFLRASWESAWLHHFGRGAGWKGRRYTR
ncbi:MAG: glycosyltransferase [Wenzhouxiangellaceae bacterium]|nr:glycosyltransferase [Wenzhouxiangellaceae bacterium]